MWTRSQAQRCISTSDGVKVTCSKNMRRLLGSFSSMDRLPTFSQAATGSSMCAFIFYTKRRSSDFPDMDEIWTRHTSDQHITPTDIDVSAIRVLICRIWPLFHWCCCGARGSTWDITILTSSFNSVTISSVLYLVSIVLTPPCLHNKGKPISFKARGVASPRARC